MTGRESELHRRPDDVDRLAVLGSEQVRADDLVGGTVDEDLAGGGGLSYAVVEVPATGVPVADIDILP